MVAAAQYQPLKCGVGDLPESRYQRLRAVISNLCDQFRLYSPPTVSQHPLVVFIATSIFWMIVLLVSHVDPDKASSRTHRKLPYEYGTFTDRSRLVTCGSSIEDAIDGKCYYDILSNHWMPSPCMDQASVEEYQKDGSWFGFADENRTQMLTVMEMSELEFYYTSERDHIVHCAMLWRKQFRAFAEERPNIDTLIASKEHTDHCSQFLINMTDRGPDYWNMPIKTHVGFGGCWIKEQ
ncbi:hypothetical protein TGAM01_v203601 [Trichoderma gamsii]|uniref:Uncharacterized protein n=1 Tax=Trichoderma gamsii TaxID=398673 RepID=A0A2P4ZU68_9HYPO|nr:hypothetical protein TGAM01_v203601 [Trichoderma gamsii]PON27834.1 hypothetical protein TGAM01_v203601 [Trichoderma gamsii]